VTHYSQHVKFDGRMVIIGFGSIGQGVLPLILRHIGIDAARISIVTADDRGAAVAAALGVQHEVIRLTRDNYSTVLGERLGAGDFLVNLSVEVSSVALMELCQSLGVLYIDTCIEPWPGGYTDPGLTPSQRSNYALRESARALRAKYPDGHTAVIGHGANPGLVSHFVKQALVNMAEDLDLQLPRPSDRQGWAQLARTLGVKTIHIAERDTQVPIQPKAPGEFVNTWSIDGFVSEGCPPAELGGGTHEKALPADGRRHDFGPDCAIYLMRPGASVRVRTWTPLAGAIHGFLITHNESISLADFFTLSEDGKPVYRPTVHYAYHPCDSAVLSVHELAGRSFHQQERTRLLGAEEIASGIDELGVLLMGNERGVYWYGSQLSNEEARRLVPYNNATGLQVTIPVLGGIVWAIEHPHASILDADELDFDRVLEVCMPYLGPVVGRWGHWSPLDHREELFPEDIDREDPWQFRNIRVS
jgi:homospermidine synthase